MGLRNRTHEIGIVRRWSRARCGAEALLGVVRTSFLSFRSMHLAIRMQRRVSDGGEEEQG